MYKNYYVDITPLILQEKNILSLTINIEDQYLVSSTEFVYFVQKQLKEVYHVVISRAKFDNMLTSYNLLVLCCANEMKNHEEYCLFRCEGSFLTFYSEQLLKNYFKFIKSKEMIVWIGLSKR
jgi:hypothetical protein